MPKNHDSQPKTELFNQKAPVDPMPKRQADADEAPLTQNWELIITIGSETERLPVQPILNIGRAEDTDVDITLDLGAYGARQQGVSRHHATISLHDGLLYLQDMGSTNGTRINGFQLTPYQKYCLRDGDEVEFGRLRTFIRFAKPAST